MDLQVKPEVSTWLCLGRSPLIKIRRCRFGLRRAQEKILIWAVSPRFSVKDQESYVVGCISGEVSMDGVRGATKAGGRWQGGEWRNLLFFLEGITAAIPQPYRFPTPYAYFHLVLLSLSDRPQPPERALTHA